MQIISTLRQIQTPDAASQLFRVLTETSASIESSNANLKDKPKEEAEEDAAADTLPLDQKFEISIDDQLQLLLTNLQGCSKLKMPTASSGGSNKKRFVDHSKDKQARPGQDLTGSQTLAINTAYALINEVIMHPSIMWNRQFFYSLNSMPVSEQNLMKEWFSEMNEVSAQLC